MKRIIFLHVVTGFFLCCSIAAQGKTSEGKPADRLNRECVPLAQVFTDTIPSQVKTAEVTTAKPVTETPVTTVIKAVPKARRVVAPKPVQVKVAPIKIIKPRIIKPVLKVL